jgi:4-amino-4-deoxy-L-arabinose transferase-like glycosyltransferase
MQSTAVSNDPPEDRANEEQEGRGQATTLWQRVALGLILLLALVLNFVRLGQNHFADITTGVNSYYAAAVKSMSLNWHNFFFVAFDPQGFLAIDKPPLGFWIQVLSTRIFGFSAWSLLVPEALAGVGAVAVLYLLVRRVFGPGAGLIAALALALTPISVVTSRNNTIDSLLILTLLLAAWALSIAAETGRLRWLLLSALVLGLGFNIKMLEAYVVLPAFGLVYLLGAPRSLRARLLHLVLALVVLLIVSFSWIAIVDLTPASQRPYVSSTQHDSELELALGYNGLSRAFGVGAGSVTHTSSQGGTSTVNATTLLVIFGIANTGRPGPLRLFGSQLGGQISWLMLFALCGLIAVIKWKRPSLPRRAYEQGLLLWGTWFITLLLFFSFALFDHAYYMVTFAPALCALVGIGGVVMYRAYRDRSGWRAWLLPCALIATALVQESVLFPFPRLNAVLAPVVLGLSLLSALVLIIARLAPRLPRLRLASPFTALGLIALLLAPALWSALPLVTGNDTVDPQAGPPHAPTALTIIAHAFLPESATAQPELIHYLLAHQGQASYLVATVNAPTAAPFILETGKAALALGGFNGFDTTLTVQQLAAQVAQGKVRFFLLPSFAPDLLQTLAPALRQAFAEIVHFQKASGGQAALPIQPAITQWVRAHCVVVPRSVAEPGVPGPQQSVDLGETYTFPTQLFDCAPQAG